MFGIHRNFPAGGGGGTGDATAEQWHIKNGKTAYIASGKVTGNAYTPALLKYDGSSYQSKSCTIPSATGLMAIWRFNMPSFTGSSAIKYIFERRTVSGGYGFGALIHSSDHTDTDRRDKMTVFVQDNTGAAIARIISASALADNTLQTVFFSYDASAGSVVLRVNGSDEADAGNADYLLTTGTLPSGSANLYIGASGVPTASWDDQIGFFGMLDSYLTNWSDFMRSDGSPIYQDPASSWSGSGFGAQPLFYNPHGDLVNNLGSAGNASRTGTIIVGDGGNT